MVLFAKKVKKAQGIELINEVAGRFNDMVDELDQGVEDCRNEQISITNEIECLRERNACLDTSVKRAATIATNLRTLLGG